MANPRVRMQKNDAEKELDPLTKFLQTIRACSDINKMMAVWDRYPPTALVQSIRVQPEKRNVQATDSHPPTELVQTSKVQPEKSNVQTTDPPRRSVRTIMVQNKKTNVQATNRCPPIMLVQTTRVRR